MDELKKELKEIKRQIHFAIINYPEPYTSEYGFSKEKGWYSFDRFLEEIEDRVDKSLHKAYELGSESRVVLIGYVDDNGDVRAAGAEHLPEILKNAKMDVYGRVLLSPDTKIIKGELK